MKRGVYIISFFILIATLCGGFFIYQGFINSRKIELTPVISQTPQPTLNPGNQPFVISKSTMVGFWQDAPFLASSYSDRYRFYDSGMYEWYNSNMDCNHALVKETGTYDVSDDKVILYTVTQTNMVGVELGYNSPNCGPSGGLSGKKETTNLKTPRITTLPVSTICSDTTGR